jgi:hypothetical protein
MIEVVKKLPEYNFDFEKIKADVFEIMKWHSSWPQIGLTHSGKDQTDMNKLLESVGSRRDYGTPTDKFKETDFTIFNEAYRNTSLYEMYQAIPGIGRFRIMVMEGPGCYTIHRDQTKRYHYVIETNPDCIFLFPSLKQQYHIPADGNLYLVDTRYKHTFVNGSRKRRIHLVLDDIAPLLNKSN